MVYLSSFQSLLFILTMISADALTKSSCSPYLFATNLDIRTNHEYVQPCPVRNPCQCLCEMESKHLWIDCFHRQLTSLPHFEEIPTNKTVMHWSVDLAFNSFENLTYSNWIPIYMHIHHLVFSSSLAYDLIIQLNLTHRHLVDIWPSQQHLSLALNDNEDEDLEENIDPHPAAPSYDEYIRLLNDLTLRLQLKTKPMKNFALSLAGEPASVGILYLDHNSLDEFPIEALYNATNLYEIYLSYNNISSLPAYAFGFSHRLTRVDLSYNQISTISNNTFQRHPEAFAGPFLIDYLDLSHNRLTSLETNIFSYLVNLRLLKLEHNQIYSLSVHVWTGLYRLKYLDLSHNHLQNFTQVFYNSYLNELNHLKITSNNISQLGPCEFLSLKALNKLNLNGNNLSNLDTCAFHGLPRTTSLSSLHIHLRSNHFETLHPCIFTNFARSTIHLENNPLVCNCSFNYLLYDRKSLAYTGRECGGGFAYHTQTQLSLPAVRKPNKVQGKKPVNMSLTCRDTYKYYNKLCSKIDCTSVCSPNERLIIQIITVPIPNGTHTNLARTFLLFFLVFLLSFLGENCLSFLRLQY